MMMVFDAVVVAVGYGFGIHVHWLGLLMLAVLLAILAGLMAAFSVATALATKDISSFAAIINGLNLPLLLLAGVLLPIPLGPLWMRVSIPSATSCRHLGLLPLVRSATPLFGKHSSCSLGQHEYFGRQLLDPLMSSPVTQPANPSAHPSICSRQGDAAADRAMAPWPVLE